MAHSHHLLLLVTLVSLFFGAQAYKALVAPITQTGPSSAPFTITLSHRENLVIDIESPFSWHKCPTQSPYVLCHAPQCIAAQSNKPPCRYPVSNTAPKHPSNVPCRCFTSPFNPFTKKCASSQLTYTKVSISSTNGHNPLANAVYNKVYVSCAPKSFLTALPKNSTGIASLSKGSLSLISQFDSSKVSKKFGMCLGDQGVAFFGDGPYFLLPPPGRDISQILQFTSLLSNPKDTLGYYIGLKKIAINGQAVNLLKGALSFDAHGNGGVKLSTVTPFTTLRSSIYNAFISLFSKATSGYPHVPKVAPFDLCYNSTLLGSTRLGYAVPPIDLELSNGANWTVFGGNSITQVSDDVACLAVVDGGKMAKQAVVIGAFQMQHNFLLFDLDRQRLGFSSLLFGIQTTCNNFNFTSGV